MCELAPGPEAPSELLEPLESPTGPEWSVGSAFKPRRPFQARLTMWAATSSLLIERFSNHH